MSWASSSCASKVPAEGVGERHRIAQKCAELRGSGAPSEPRIAERMQVQMSEVEATQGMRAHMGMSAKLSVVDGIQIWRYRGDMGEIWGRYGRDLERYGGDIGKL